MAIIPLISSGVAGPLGAIHLPRLWQKVTLNAHGQLAEDYPECGMGFDQMTLDGLGLDRDATLAHIKASKPSYAQFEAWVKSNGNATDEAIAAHNAAVRGYNHDDDTRKEILAAAGIADDGSILDAVNLNNLDDWTEFHQGGNVSSVPLISSDVAGPLGAIHLPRLWQKVTLDTNGQLAEGYPECGMGFDQMTLDGLGLDRDATLAYIKGSKPSYAQFEAWVKSNGNATGDAIAAHNAAVRGYNHDDDTRKEILAAAGIADDGSILDAVNLNNLDDWTEFHQGL